MKAGLDIRALHTFSATADLMDLRFSPGMTAATWPSPDTTTSGDPYASFLLGALDGGSPARLYPIRGLRSTSTRGISRTIST